MALRPVSYRWNGEDSQGQSLTHQGFIAQEVEAVFPEFVTTGSDGKKSVAYSNFIPAMVQAIQTINAKVNTLDTRLTNLEALVASSTEGQVVSSGGLTFIQIIEEFANQFETIGVKFMDGIAYFKNIFTDKLTVGSTLKPSGITLYDEVTNEPYCLKMQNGAMASIAGICTTATTPTATTTPDAVPQTADDTIPVISILGDNPAVVTVGTSYSDMSATVTDTGVNSLDLTGPLVTNNNLGLHYSVDGVDMNDVSIDTSTSTTHTVVYSAVDGSGNWGYATRTVEVIAQ